MVIPCLENKEQLVDKAVNYYLEIRNDNTDKVINNIYKRNLNVFKRNKYYQNNPNQIILECMFRFLLKYSEYIKLIPAAPGKFKYIDIQKRKQDEGDIKKPQNNNSNIDNMPEDNKEKDDILEMIKEANKALQQSR